MGPRRNIKKVHQGLLDVVRYFSYKNNQMMISIQILCWWEENMKETRLEV